MTSDAAGTRIAWEYVFQSVPDSKIQRIAPLPDGSSKERAIVRDVVDPESIETTDVAGSLESRMRGLEKPLGEIEFTNSNASKKAPTNQASNVLVAETPVFFTTLAKPVQAPNRYPIAAMHTPLYFEDIRLERCGHTFGCAQTAVSAVRFLAQTAILPYQIVERPWCMVECDRMDCQNRSAAPALSSCDGLVSAGGVREVDGSNPRSPWAYSGLRSGWAVTRRTKAGLRVRCHVRNDSRVRF